MLLAHDKCLQPVWHVVEAPGDVEVTALRQLTALVDTPTSAASSPWVMPRRLRSLLMRPDEMRAALTSSGAATSFARSSVRSACARC